MKKTNKIFILFLLGLFSQKANAQVKDNPTSINPLAVFEIESTSKGFLPPRMTTLQRNSVLTTATGIVIYNNTKNWLEYFNGTCWMYNCEGAISPQGGGDSSSVVSTRTSSIGCSIGAGPNNSLEGVHRGGVIETIVQGIPTPSTESITLVANVATVGTYSVFTNTVNGITFSATVTFSTSGNHIFTLLPTGTPSLAGNYMWVTNCTPSIDVYGCVITSNAYLGRSYNAHFNGIVNGPHVGGTQVLVSQTTGQTFNNNTTCISLV